MKLVKQLLKIFFFILIIGIIGFFFITAKVVDRQYNKSVLEKMPQVSEKAKALHQTLTIADWHADNLLWDRNPLKKLSHGHVDIPRLIEGNYTLQVFDAVIKSPKGQNYNSNTDETDNITLLAMGNRWPPKTWTSLCERAIHQSNVLHNAERKSDGRLAIVKSKADLNTFLQNRKANKNMVAGLLAIEGLHVLEEKIENLDYLYDHGYRLMGLVHFFDNAVGGSSAGTSKGGLTKFGEKVIRQMEAKSITIDLAHASSKLIRDVLKIATKPVVVSHTGVKGIHNSQRNLSDEELKLIAKNGGLIGIGFWKGAIGNIEPENIAKAIKYTAGIVGIDKVCLGSDFDGSVKTYFDASQIILLTEALIKVGFSDYEIRKVMGENQIDFLKKHLPD